MATGNTPKKTPPSKQPIDQVLSGVKTPPVKRAAKSAPPPGKKRG
jgi:hypothetical protein